MSLAGDKRVTLSNYTADKFYYLSLVRNNVAEQFRLGGLWPQFAHGYPSYCGDYDRALFELRDASELRQLLPQLISKWWCRPDEPSARSLQFWLHQYTKHGTCMYKQVSLPEYFRLCLSIYDAAKKHQKTQDALQNLEACRVLIPVDLDFEFR